MSLVSADKGQAGDGPHPPFGQLESRVSSLAQTLEMRRLPGGPATRGHPREADCGAAPQVVPDIVAASRQPVCRVMPPLTPVDTRPAQAHNRGG